MSAGWRARRRLLLLLALLLLAGGASGSICDTATCGMGDCTEVPGPVPSLPRSYECHCDPGWSHVVKDLLLSPCIVPDCSFHAACLNLSMTPPPRAIPSANICAVVNCGAGGVCKAGSSGLFSYSCDCQPGYTNLIYNKTALPCANNCFFGKSCSALGLGAPAPAPAPSSGDQSSPPGPSPSAPPPPPSGTKGSASSPSLLPLLLLLFIAMVQVV